MFRPVLVTENANNVLDSAVVTRYDTSGKTVFASYPTRQFSDINATLTGTTTQYDALAHGGQSIVRAGALVTRTEYGQSVGESDQPARPGDDDTPSCLRPAQL